MIKFNFKSKRYILDTNVLIFNVIMVAMIIVLVVGTIYVCNQDYAYALQTM